MVLLSRQLILGPAPPIFNHDRVGHLSGLFYAPHDCVLLSCSLALWMLASNLLLMVLMLGLLEWFYLSVIVFFFNVWWWVLLLVGKFRFFSSASTSWGESVCWSFARVVPFLSLALQLCAAWFCGLECWRSGCRSVAGCLQAGLRAAYFLAASLSTPRFLTLIGFPQGVAFLDVGC